MRPVGIRSDSNSQLPRLIKLLEHAEEHVPHYRESFARSGVSASAMRNGSSEYESFPILNKADLQRDTTALIDERVDRRQLARRMSSATTGQPVITWKSKQELLIAERIRQNTRSYLYPDVVTDSWADIHFAPTGQRGSIDGFGRSALLSVTRTFDDGVDLTSAVTWLNRAQPSVLTVRANVLRIWRGAIATRGALRLRYRPSLIEIMGEYISQYEKDETHDIFDTRVAEHYGSEETFSIAIGCPDGRLHVIDAAVLVEESGDNYDGDLRPVVVTSLIFRAMPIIRYRLGDLVKIRWDQCACGARSMTLRLGRGRLSDRLMGWPELTGSSLFPRFFEPLLSSCILDYRVLEMSRWRFRVLIRPGPQFTASAVSALLRELAAKLRGAEFEVILTETIPPHRSGKRVVFMTRSRSK